MEVVGPGTEAADHESVALEGLMYRRRLVHSSHDGLEVVDVEGPGIEVPVPAYNVERMMVQDDLVEPIVLLDQNPEVPPFVVGPKLGGAADVALAVGRPLDQL